MYTLFTSTAHIDNQHSRTNRRVAMLFTTISVAFSGDT
jgi:hypothetical protein